MPNLNQNSSISKNTLFTANGRFSRLSYLAWLLINSLIYSCALMFVVAFGLFAALGSSLDPSLFLSTGLGLLTIILFVGIVIIFIVISVLITIRRLHDINKSGWMCLLFFIPVVNLIFALYLIFAPGTPGENNYGPVRPTEQTERVLGIVYAVLCASMLLSYVALFTVAASLQNNSQASFLEALQNQTGLDVEAIESDSQDSESMVESEETKTGTL